MMTANEIRKTFLDFFASKGHQIVPSAPMVVKNDPTLMFNNSGMAPFKDIFLGISPIKYPRVADTQKCLRVSGKHNDLEEVGVDTYHHTMFEMLGNWSFGDYFKAEAIAWAWELLTEVYKIDKSRMYVTVFEGDDKEGLAFDQEAFDHWKKLIGEDRIINGNKKDNFWEMGDQGPCGPCSEIHVDCRTDEDRALQDGKELVNMGHPQVIEIWNLVFMEFNRKANGSLEKLPAQHVDTGMGFERLCVVLQGKQSNYDTDVFTPLLNQLERISLLKYGMSKQIDIAMRVCADHIRTIAFAIADGQLPSNNKAGYVIRRILRRAVRYYYTFLKIDEPSLYRLVSTLADQMSGIFPELKAQQDLIEKVIKEEETAFLRTLGNGIKRFEDYVKQPNNDNPKTVVGAFAFELYDTFGFPIDLTQLLAREAGFVVDMGGFNEYLEQQKNRSRAATAIDTGDWVVLEKDDVEEFIGYDTLEVNVRIVKYRKVTAKGKDQYQLVFDLTPFYAEGGGQVGDKGVIYNEKERIDIIDTKKENALIIHFADKLPKDLNGVFKAEVFKDKRNATENNHSATHLMHAALRQVLGTHVEQKGSLVTPDYLRFDFSHFAKVTDEEIARIEAIVNAKIRENIQRNTQLLPIEEAKKLGAMALFGEKYGEEVRVVTFDPKYSIELCGGTHVNATGQIGLFKITAESAVAAGVRRIEAITADAAQQFVDGQLGQLKQVRELLKNPKDTVKAIEGLVAEKAALEKQLESLLREKTTVLAKEIAAKGEELNGTYFISAKVELPNSDAVKDLAFMLKDTNPNAYVALGAVVNGKPSLTIALGAELAKSGKYHAGNTIRELAKEINGGGGGQPHFATAGGSDADGLDTALSKAKAALN